MNSSILLGLQSMNRQRKTHSGQPLWSITHRVRLHLAMSLLHLLCNQELHRRLVQPIGLVDRLSVFKKVHLTISSFLKAVFEAVDR